MLRSKRARLMTEVARSNTKQNETVTVVKTANSGSIFMDATKLSDVQEWVNETVTTPVSINVENDDDVITSDIELGDSFDEDYDDEDKDKNYEPPLVQSTEFVELHENIQEPPLVQSTELINYNINEDGDKVFWNSIKVFEIEKDNPTILKHKTSYNEKTFKNINVRQKKENQLISISQS